MSTNNRLGSFVEQLDSLIDYYNSLRQSSKYDDLSDLLESDVIAFITPARSAIYRITGSSSTYVKQCEEIIVQSTFYGRIALLIFGVITSLRKDLLSGYIANLTELIHGELFADFLDMALHLLKEGYKDAAAVIAGSALESHLRQLCIKAGIETETERDDKIQPKKADRMNSDLAKNEIYSKSDQKSVTAWLDLRNDAAHGHYDKYTKEQVSLLISGIRDFLTRNPA